MAVYSDLVPQLLFSPMLLDRAPYPAEWALSRVLEWPLVEDVSLEIDQRSHRELKLDYEINIINFRHWCDLEGYSAVPHIYATLLHRTKTFTENVKELVALTMKHSPSDWGEAASLIVNYSVSVLTSAEIKFKRFLPSQRASIYWLLDEALLRICLDQWDNDRTNKLWDKVTETIRLYLSSAQENVNKWATLELQKRLEFWDARLPTVEKFTKPYFQRTLSFLNQSMRLYEIWRTVAMSRIGKLPMELMNGIIEDILDSERLPKGELKHLYLLKGKSKDYYAWRDS